MANEKRLISLDEALKSTRDEIYWTESQQAAVRLFLVQQPRVDAVEVVRCKECKKCGTLEHNGKLYCKEPMGCLGCVPTKPDNFCSYGERKDKGYEAGKKFATDNNVGSKWIPVGERLPKEDGVYLVRTTTGAVTTARFYAFKSFPATKHLPAVHRNAAWQTNRNVTHWMPLPEPPQGGE